MLTNKYRPTKFEDVVGQEDAVTVLRAIALRPDTSPRVVILHGAYGTGKTTMARIFGKALNCLSHKGDTCGSCEVCCSSSQFDPLYQENDSSRVGNVAFVREYRDQLEQSTPPTGKYRVIVFDEIQEASGQSMDALLTILESVPERTFFVFCTTEIDKVHSTIRSRAVELPVFPVHYKLIAGRLLDICKTEGVAVTEELAQAIALSSGGHVRDAVMRLDVCLLSGSVPTTAISSCESVILRFLKAARTGSKADAERCIEDMAKRPLAYLFGDWERTVLSLLKGFSGSPDPSQVEVLGLYGAEVFSLLRALSSDWVSRCFKDDVLFQALMWYMYYEFGKGAKQKEVAPAQNVFQK